ncbi:MAG: AtpZ/AtpI family protein [Bacteroidota bacterium]
MKSENPIQKPLNAYAKYSSLGIQMALIISIGCYGGYRLDNYFHNTTKIFTIILSLSSIALALYVVLKDLIKPTK